MNITALTSTGQQTRAIQHSRPRLLLTVMTWEFRRFRASRLFWFQALGLFGLLLIITWASHAPDHFSTQNVQGGELLRPSVCARRPTKAATISGTVRRR